MKRLKTAETLVTNLRALMRETGMKRPELAQRSGVSVRMINYILSAERKPTIEVADALASAFGLTGWQLLIPGLSTELAKSGKLTKLVDNYSKSSNQGRDYIDRVAEQEARYRAT